jgi:deazaflavin-dependent oxidoreductase (nitroreductase family)
MSSFGNEVIQAAASEREATLTTYGRKSGKARDVTIWLTTDGKRLYIRSGQGLSRQWPQNLVARGKGLLHLGKLVLEVKPRLIADPVEARATTTLYTRKYGLPVKASSPQEPLTPGEQASFELIPAE